VNSQTTGPDDANLVDVLAKICGQALELEHVDTDTGLFRLGATSLELVDLSMSIEQSLGVVVPMEVLLAGPTICELTDFVAAGQSAGGNARPDATALAEPDAPRPALRGPESALSFAQERVWFIDQLTPGNIAYQIQHLLRLHGPLSKAHVAQALAVITERHETFRSRIVTTGGEGRQRVDDMAEPAVEFINLATIDSASRKPLAEIVAALVRRTIPMSDAPMLRWTLFRLAHDEHALLLMHHHTIFDGYSLGVLLTEFVAAYQALERGSTPEFPEPPVQFADFAQWQRDWITSADAKRQQAFWHRTLNAQLPPLDLPGSRPRPSHQSLSGAAYRQALSPGLYGQVEQYASAHAASPFTVFLAALAIMLARYTGVEDIQIGTAVANRRRDATKTLIGMVCNTVVLRIDMSGEPTFAEAVERVRRMTTEVLNHQDYPFERLVEEINPRRSAAHNPLFQIALTFQNTPLPPLQFSGVDAEVESLRNGSAKFDAEIIVVPPRGQREAASTGELILEYATDLLEPAAARRMAHYLLTLLSEVVAPEVRAAGGDVSIGVGEVVSFPGGLVLGGGAGDVAVVDDEVSVSYEVFDEWVGRFAQRLRALGVGRGVRVGVCLPRSVELLVAVWAVARAGGVLVPLDTSSPDVRLRGMVGDAGVALVVDAGSGNWGVPWVGVPAMGSGGAALRAGVVEVADDDPAYVLFTSGSTGRPKGVVVSRGALTNRLSWMVRDQGLCSADRVLCKTAIGFDVSLWELFGVLRVGGQVVVARDGGHRDPSYLVDVMRRCRITVVHFVPSMLPVFLDALCADGAGLPDLRLVVCSGEVLPPDLAQRCLKMLPEARLENLYGPTEAGIDVSRWRCVPGWSGVRVPIGSAVPNTQLYVLDGAGDPAAVGVVGELFIGGVQVAEGYAGAPGLTAHRFVPDPFTPGGGRLYRTGDRGRWLDGGALEFLGRMDEQVKIRGQRVEPGEIEGVLAKFSGVRAAVVMVRDRQAGEPVLTAWVHAPGPAVQVSALRDYLVRRLPAHMVPAEFVVVADWPLNASGKTDRLALLQMPAVTGSASGGPVAGSGGGATATERELLHMWEQLLGVPRMGIGDDFFDLGGHSLLAARLVNRIRDAFGIALPLGAIFEHSTITALATLIDTWHAPGREEADAAGIRA